MEQMNRTFGCCRFLYNHMLADKISFYQENHKMLRTTPARYKAEHEWLKEVDSLALANVQLLRESEGEPAAVRAGLPVRMWKRHGPGLERSSEYP